MLGEQRLGKKQAKTLSVFAETVIKENLGRCRYMRVKPEESIPSQEEVIEDFYAGQ